MQTTTPKATKALGEMLEAAIRGGFDCLVTWRDILGVNIVETARKAAAIEKMRSEEDQINARWPRVFMSHVVYLAGPMEFTEDFGAGWRKDVQSYLEGLSHIRRVINPVLEESNVLPCPPELKENDPDEYRRRMRIIIEKDIDFVLGADVFVCKYEGEIISGSPAEATYAYRNGLKTILISSLSRTKIPGWFFGCFDLHVSSIEEFKEVWPQIFAGDK